MRIAVITARAGSKGLPGKNLRQLGGQSLLARAIEAARQSACFDRIVLTTDGDDIAKEGLRLGAEVVRRPPELAADSAKSIDAVVHALQSLGASRGTAVLLQPTSPLRTAAHIAEAVALFDAQAAGSVVSAVAAGVHPFKCLLDEGNGRYGAPAGLDALEMPRQQLPAAYVPNGAVYVKRIEDLLAQRRFFVPPLQLYLMDEASSVDIDSEADLQHAAALLSRMPFESCRPLTQAAARD